MQVEPRKNTNMRHLHDCGVRQDDDDEKNLGHPEEMDASKSAGPDGIHPAIAKALAEILVKYFTQLFDELLDERRL